VSIFLFEFKQIVSAIIVTGILPFQRDIGPDEAPLAISALFRRIYPTVGIARMRG
jgi:hypothetical protein